MQVTLEMVQRAAAAGWTMRGAGLHQVHPGTGASLPKSKIFWHPAGGPRVFVKEDRATGRVTYATHAEIRRLMDGR